MTTVPQRRARAGRDAIGAVMSQAQLAQAQGADRVVPGVRLRGLRMTPLDEFVVAVGRFAGRKTPSSS